MTQVPLARPSPPHPPPTVNIWFAWTKNQCPSSKTWKSAWPTRYGRYSSWSLLGRCPDVGLDFGPTLKHVLFAKQSHCWSIFRMGMSSGWKWNVLIRVLAVTLVTNEILIVPCTIWHYVRSRHQLGTRRCCDVVATTSCAHWARYFIMKNTTLKMQLWSRYIVPILIYLNLYSLTHNDMFYLKAIFW